METKKEIIQKDRRIDDLKAQLNEERNRGVETKKSLKRELVSSSTLWPYSDRGTR